jgi:opacity protein-like surface antigen
MKRSLPFIVAPVLLFALTGRAAAQDTAAPPAPEDTHPFDIHGGIDAGYRFTDINGSTDAYKQLFNLTSGLRLMDFDLQGTSTNRENSLMDSFSLSASGFGDPFSSVQVSARKAHHYDLRINWRSSRLFDMAPLTPNSIAGLDTTAVTDHHGWNTSRQIGSAALEIDATSHLRFSTVYDLVQYQGTITSTRSLDFLDSPSVWGSFARANPYTVTGPVYDTSSRVTAGAAYSRTHWTVAYKVGYQIYDESQAFGATSPAERSIDVADPTTAAETLSLYSSSEARHLTSPVSELSFVVRPSDRFEWRGEHLYSQYNGPFTLDAVFQGIARSNTGGTTDSPYDVSSTAQGRTSAPSQVIGQGLTYRPFERWTFDVDYRYSRFSSDSSGSLGSLIALYSGAANPQAASETDDISWRQSVQTADITTTISPSRAFTLQPGIRLMERTISSWDDGVLDPATSGRERSIWPELTASYRPSAMFQARGVLQSAYSDESYTRMSPVQRTIAHAIVTVKPVTGLSINANADRTDADAYAADYISHTRGGSLTVSYALSDRFTILGGLDLRSFTGGGNVSFARGTVPFTNLPIVDREVDRVWQAGVTLKPATRVGITATGNFDRTTGTDSIFGEPPLYGPSTFPYATVSAYYELPRGGKVSVDLQRTYWLEELLPMNNFSANLLTIRYSHGF